jgi:hypothetical protein
VIEILGVDENLERPALLMLGAFVQYDVVDRDIHRMVRYRRFDLVGRANQHFRTLELLVHPDHFRAAIRRFPAKLLFRRLFRFAFGLRYRITNDLLVDFDPAHCSFTSKFALLQPENLRCFSPAFLCAAGATASSWRLSSFGFSHVLD